MNGNWRLVDYKNNEDIMLYYRIVVTMDFKDDYYLTMSTDYLKAKKETKGNNIEHWLYENADKKMALGFRYHTGKINPYTKKEGMWRINDLGYEGNWGNIQNRYSVEAALFALNAIRTRMDEKGIRDVYAHVNHQSHKDNAISKDWLMEMFMHSWELTDKRPRPTGYHAVYHFSRNKDNKPVDEENWVREGEIPIINIVEEGVL